MTRCAHRFSGCTVIVTGAGAGIGRATAERLAAEEGRVIAVDVSSERLTGLTDEVEGDIVTVAADITEPQGIDAILAAAGARIDGLANVAGIMDGFEPTAEIADSTWERVLAVNLTGMMTLTRAVLPTMLARGRGSIVNVGSEAGQRGSAAGTPYTTSKHAVNGFTVSTAFFYTPKGVRCNAVAPARWPRASRLRSARSGARRAWAHSFRRTFLPWHAPTSSPRRSPGSSARTPRTSQEPSFRSTADGRRSESTRPAGGPGTPPDARTIPNRRDSAPSTRER